MSKKIMVVDDSRFNLRLLQDILENEGFAVHAVNQSLAAIQEARIFQPDIILLDIVMPNIDGFEVCRLLKEDLRLADVPVIMITAKIEASDVKKALELGAFDYIRKPVDEVEVIARIHSAIKYKEIQDKLKEMATKDGLTGIYNHSLLLELFYKEAARCERLGKDTSFVMIDIDSFKKVNDTYGHQAGDIVLKELSLILQKNTRINDIVGRYGGEEFGIVISEVDDSELIELCERIRAKVEGYNFNVGQEIIHISVSIGICTKKPDTGVSIGEIIKRADEALYMAKKKGKNRIVISK